MALVTLGKTVASVIGKASTASEGASTLSNLFNAGKSLFGSKTSDSSTFGGDIFKALLGGLGGSADAKLMSEMYVKKAETEGREARKSSLFEYQLKDFYSQQDKVRKRAALDTYGQFSQISRWAPNYVAKNPPLATPALPNPNT